jgi:hypothetical protein
MPAGHPPSGRSDGLCCARPARNTSWGYRRIHGELLVLGVKIAASTVWEILHAAGIDPAPQRTSDTWATFLRSQAQAILAADFFETTALTGARLYVRRHRTRHPPHPGPGVTTHPTAAWVGQAACSLVMDLEDPGCKVKYLIRDRDGKYPALFDAIPADAGITVMLSGVRMPRMSAVIERGSSSAAMNCSTGRSSGARRICRTPCASTNGTTTATVLIRASRTPGRCIRCPSRSPIPPRSHVCTSADTIASAGSSTNTTKLPDLRGRDSSGLCHERCFWPDSPDFGSAGWAL